MPQDAINKLLHRPWFLVGLLGVGLVFWLASRVFRSAKWVRRSALLVGVGTFLGTALPWAPALVVAHLWLEQAGLGQPLTTVAAAVARALYVGICVEAAVRGVRHGFELVSAKFPEMQPGDRNRVVIVRKLATVVVVFVGLLVGLAVVGVDAGPLLAGSAIGGVVLGLALQESLSSVFSGMLMTWDASLRIGDFVRLEDGKEGSIESIGWRNTQLRLLDQTLLIVPNGKMATTIVTNLSRPSPETTVVLDCGVAYGSNLELVEETALEVANQVAVQFGGGEVSKQPALRWRDFGDNSLDFRILVPIASHSDIHQARSELVRKLYGAFEQKGITVPLPQRVVHMAAPTD